MEKSCKPAQKYETSAAKMKYKTEYNDVYIERTLTKQKEFECLSPEQIKDYVMGILRE